AVVRPDQGAANAGFVGQVDHQLHAVLQSFVRRRLLDLGFFIYDLANRRQGLGRRKGASKCCKNADGERVKQLHGEISLVSRNEIPPVPLAIPETHCIPPRFPKLFRLVCSSFLVLASCAKEKTTPTYTSTGAKARKISQFLCVSCERESESRVATSAC